MPKTKISFPRSLRETLSALQQPKDLEEEDAREEALPEPRVQRVVRVRPAQVPGQLAGQGAAGAGHARLGPRHQERGDREAGAGR